MRLLGVHGGPLWFQSADPLDAIVAWVRALPAAFDGLKHEVSALSGGQAVAPAAAATPAVSPSEKRKCEQIAAGEDAAALPAAAAAPYDYDFPNHISLMLDADALGEGGVDV